MLLEGSRLRQYVWDDADDSCTVCMLYAASTIALKTKHVDRFFRLSFHLGLPIW